MRSWRPLLGMSGAGPTFKSSRASSSVRGLVVGTAQGLASPQTATLSFAVFFLSVPEMNTPVKMFC